MKTTETVEINGHRLPVGAKAQEIHYYMQGATGEVAATWEWLQGVGVPAKVSPVEHPDFTSVKRDENGDWIEA